jgi:hypothetical protein
MLALRGSIRRMVKCPRKRTQIAILSFMMWPKRKRSRKRLWRKLDSSREQESVFSFRIADRRLGLLDRRGGRVLPWLRSVYGRAIPIGIGRHRPDHPIRRSIEVGVFRSERFACSGASPLSAKGHVALNAGDVAADLFLRRFSGVPPENPIRDDARVVVW